MDDEKRKMRGELGKEGVVGETKTQRAVDDACYF